MPIASLNRPAAALLLVYPASIVAGNAIAALEDDWAGHLANGLLLVLFLAIVGVQLWRGRQWAYTAGLACSAALTAILVLYHAVVWRLYSHEMWDGWSRVDLVLHVLPFAALATVFVLLARSPATSAERRRALTLLAAALGVELVLMALIARFGVGGFFGGKPWYQTVLSASQAPGEIILAQMGMCCGYENHTIISDWFDLHWGGITRDGIPVLVVANALGLVLLFSIVRALLVLVIRARPRAPAPAK